ncbi:SCO4402 family protein [Kribbella sp. GL6]|uniref:SCO4402 family protein n=1 Tax=Kribbella sp. GL6 TaxID=3419765 RepID=UPI003D01F328
MDVQWPARRRDVIEALDVLASEPPTTDGAGHDPRWPDVTNAVHWLVDDTFWDIHDPADSIGTILRDQREAVVVRRVVAAVVAVSERQGATSTDARWFADEG